MRSALTTLFLAFLAGGNAIAADCRDFLVAGREYTIEYTTTRGPSGIGQVQTKDLTATKTDVEGGCKKVSGTWAEEWTMTLTGCDKLDIVAKKSGNKKDMTGQATCTATEAKGSFGYVDSANQTWGYTLRITTR